MPSREWGTVTLVPLRSTQLYTGSQGMRSTSFWKVVPSLSKAFSMAPMTSTMEAPTSKWKPSLSKVEQQPPTRSLCSSTRTLRPSLARMAPAERPPPPAPMTMTS